MDRREINAAGNNKDIEVVPIRKKNKILSGMFFMLLLTAYILAWVETTAAARSAGEIRFLGVMVPIAIFAGVFTALGNVLIVFLVIYFKKRGFIVALSLLVIQFPVLTVSFILGNSPSSIPGLFTNLFTIVMIILIYRKNKSIERYQQDEIRYFKEQRNLAQRLFEQTATALVNAIDAKDKYSHGHSMRVAEYSRKLAEAMGKSEDECYKIYYTALLHDVGKIGIKNDILNKKGKLTGDEYENIKQHAVIGNQILSSISEYPYLSIGAHYHHERYDGKGYPDKLKGEDIPEIARIISVADAYDAMTSRRSYRDAIPQQIVREEIVKNSGTQFDPKIAAIMKHFIDLDVEYEMKERTVVKELAGKHQIRCEEYGSEISDGILVMPAITKIRLECLSDRDPDSDMPSFLIFDSLDGRFHDDEKTAVDLCFFEYGEVRFDGRYTCKGARKIKTDITSHETGIVTRSSTNSDCIRKYEIEAVRITDHMLIKIDDGMKLLTITIALPDASRYTYLALTGQRCTISKVSIRKSEEFMPRDYIPRIAEWISYIDAPEGNVPNVQIDSHRSAYSDGIKISDGMKIVFHTKSLPTARLIWHCPFVNIFHSDNGKVTGDDYKDYALIRVDGENWSVDGDADNEIVVNRNDKFDNWDGWKKFNKDGYECVISFAVKGDQITVKTENYGIEVINTTTIRDGMTDIYAALTGDQVALTGIRVIR